MNITHQRLCVHSAIPFIVFLGLTFVIPGWIPPLPASLSAEEVALFYQANTFEIRLAGSSLAFASILCVPLWVALAAQMKRIEGEQPVLANVQLLCGLVISIIPMYTAYFWLTAAYRPDLDVATLTRFSDMGWMVILGSYPSGFIQEIAVGLCVLSAKPDKSGRSIYPRWYGYFALWVAVLQVPAVLVPFLKVGPFAWDGLFVFWVPVAVLFTFYAVTWWTTLSAINRQQAIATPDIQ